MPAPRRTRGRARYRRWGSHVPFEVILGQVSDHTGAFVPTYLQMVTPVSAPHNPNHLATASLALGSLSAQSKEKLVVTTNFDECSRTHRAAASRLPFHRKGPSLLRAHRPCSNCTGRSQIPQALGRRRPLWQGETPASCATRLPRAWLAAACSSSATASATRSTFLRLFRRRHRTERSSTGPARKAKRTTRFGFRLRQRSPHNLFDANRNLLRRLVPDAGKGYVDPAGAGDQLAVARRGCEAAQAEVQTPVAARLAAFGALCYWLEKESVCRRLTAIASRDRSARATLAAHPWRDKRRIEWAKI